VLQKASTFKNSPKLLYRLQRMMEHLAKRLYSKQRDMVNVMKRTVAMQKRLYAIEKVSFPLDYKEQLVLLSR
jgi:hypothetical protein